jgi:uncharacterized protein YqhQ
MKDSSKHQQHVHPLYLPLVISGVVFWTFLYFISDRLLPSHLRKSLTASQLKDMRSRIVSTLHALYAFAISIYLLSSDDEFSKLSIIHGTEESDFLFSYTLGYFIYDFILILTDWKQLGGMYCY